MSILIPDLLVIHSSEVSIFFDKSSLETIFVGKYDPTPVNNIEFEMCNLPIKIIYRHINFT